MMAGNPNWWSMMNGMHPPSSNSQFVYGSSNHPPLSSTSNPPDQDFPVRSWSQLLLGGLGSGEDERYSAGLFQQQKKLESWEDQVLNLNPTNASFTRVINNNHVHAHVHDGDGDGDVKQEVCQSTSCHIYGHQQVDLPHQDEPFHPNISRPSNSWSTNAHHQNQVISVSSPISCITTNFLNFSASKASVATEFKTNHDRLEDQISEGNSRSTGGVSKKARVQQSSAQPALKVRKEKLGDRITALHQLVSPFGKTDTASVLSEAIGYIRFLQGQIEALSSPYMRNASGSTGSHQYSDSQVREVTDLRSRGLCLVPISCTQHVENQNGADYWASAALGGGF